MKRAPISYHLPRSSKEQLARLYEIERDYHRRAFGEELARVNLDFTIEQRREYAHWMRKSARLGKKQSKALPKKK